MDDLLPPDVVSIETIEYFKNYTKNQLMIHRRYLALLFIIPTFVLLISEQTFTQEKGRNPLPRDYHYPYPQFITRGGNEDTQLQAIFDLTGKANAGDAIAQYELGLYYLLGIGSVPDTVKAAYWTRKAAEQHHAVASYNMAVFLTNGWGIQWDPFEAFRDIQYAAKAGLPEAQYFMCRFLIENLVVPRDIKQAYRWVKIAADSGYAPAKDVAAEFIKRGWIHPGETVEAPKPSQHDKDKMDAGQKNAFQPVFLDFSHDTVAHVDDQTLIKEALHELEARKDVKEDSFASGKDSIVIDTTMRKEIYRNALEGTPEAWVVLARWIQNGNGVKKDVILAAADYIRAMKLDSPRAPRLLWDMIQNEKFYAHLKSRVDGGDPVAQYVWAELVALGFDHQITEAQSWDLLQSAAEKHYEPALIEVGMNYFIGFWVKQDKERALELLHEAAEMGSLEARIRIITVQTVGVSDAVLLADSLTLLLNSAEKGSVLSQALLGYCHEAGIGVHQSKTLAARYYRDAAQRGSQTAFKGLRRMYDELRPKGKEFQLEE
jgi:uncharacterized protein